MDVSLTSLKGPGLAHAPQSSRHPPTQDTRVEMSKPTTEARADSHNAHKQAEDDQKPAQTAQHNAKIDTEKPAGPPPSFDVSFLEMERELQQKLAQLELSHAQETGANDSTQLEETQFEHTSAAPEAQQNPDLKSAETKEFPEEKPK